MVDVLMKMVMPIGTVMNKIGVNASVDLYAKAGFDGLDFSFFDGKYHTDAYNDDYFTELKKYAEDKGVVFAQAHAPFPSSIEGMGTTDKIFTGITTSMKRAASLGIKIIVVHPCQHLVYAQEGVPEELFSYNMDFYKRLIPYCEEYGIKVALENMWQFTGKKVNHSTCSKPEEFIEYMDGLNNNCFTACLDIGHAALVSEDIPDFINKLGNRLGALHIHDVDGFDDSHTIPYLGIIDWERIAKALADNNYQGNFTYECNNMMFNKPIELYDAYAKVMADTGRLLIKKIESYK